MILTGFSLFFFGVEVLLLPAQLYSYLELKIDKTRLRFLLLTLSIVCFNILWVLSYFILDNSYWIKSSLLGYGGILLGVHYIYYLIRELNLTFNSKQIFVFLLSFVFTKLLYDSSQIIVSSEFLLIAKLFFFISFQFITILFASIILRGIYRRESDDRTPIENVAIGTVVTLMFLPLVIFHVNIESLYNLIVNFTFLVVATTYFYHFAIKIKLERKVFPRKGEFGNNLYDQFIRVPKIFFEYDLSARERQISIYLLKGLSYEEIAEKIFVTAGAVRKQGSKAFAKAGVSNLKEFRQKFEYKNGKISSRENI